MAKPGYGKRSAPDQSPPRKGDFGHLPARAAYLASLLDRLCENAAMDAKTIAKSQPLYGQAAVRSTLNELGVAGHLRRVRQSVPPGEGVSGTRWVVHTYWSRTARDNEWWATFLKGDVTDVQKQRKADVQEDPDSEEGREGRPEASRAVSPAPLNSPCAERSSGPSVAYDTLAQLGLREPRLVLSANDCAALEQLAADWLDRGATPEHLAHALVAGLPEPVHSPRALVRRRLLDKMPPERAVVPPAPVAPGPRRPLLMECTDCGVPGRPEALPGGLCRGCRSQDGRGGPGAPGQSVRRADPTVRALAAQVRAGMRAPQRV
ncbi:hypothetical protein ADL01_09880 [Streptomyces sp. NRRL WC-3618]|uniref:hypothetical protein n=1 Tax=Streptomyces sp. NRRL WC-3618 TaxID=1519490 RepID=UPI0006AEFD88|nr:hypothetical protein [Streptomyces sp. NRRL WC-3618]KOV82781.1 hypothetical protein ADL01_09880 [Streptomyces sp. NRRL WC-3618]